jgi:DNA-binding transcriptional ArsR family regulator
VVTYAPNGLTALGDATRRRIFERVASKPQSVVELAHGMPVSRPAVSQHLRVLRAARLVSERKQGTRRIYSVDRRGLEAIRRYLDRFWDQALDQFKAAAEAAERNEQ